MFESDLMLSYALMIYGIHALVLLCIYLKVLYCTAVVLKLLLVSVIRCDTRKG